MFQKLKTTNILVYIFICIIFVIPIYKVLDINYVYTIDPWVHMYLTTFGETVSYYSNSIQMADELYEFHYPTLMRSTLYNLQLMIWTELLPIFKYTGFLMRALLSIIILIFSSQIIKDITGKKTLSTWIYIWLLWVIFSHYYFWMRSWITFTENFILVFHTLLAYFGYMVLRSDAPKSWYIYTIFFFLSVSMRYHRPSFVVSAFYIWLFWLIYIYKFWIDKKLIYSGIWSILISIPVITWLIEEYTRQFKENIWETWWYWDWDLSRFVPPWLSDYIWFSSQIVIFLLLFICLLIVVKTKRLHVKDIIHKYNHYIFIIFCRLFVFFLSNTTRVWLNLPLDRMQWFLMPMLLIASSISFWYIYQSKTSTIKIIMITLSVLVWLTYMNNSKPRFKLRKWEMDAWAFINSTYDADKNYFFDEISFMELNFNHPESILLSGSNLESWDYYIKYIPKNSTDSNLIYATGSVWVYVQP